MSINPNQPHHAIWPARLPRELVLPETSLWFNTEVTAKRYPNKAAYIFCGLALTYAQLHDQAVALAGCVGNGDTKEPAAVPAPDSPNAFLTYPNTQAPLGAGSYTVLVSALTGSAADTFHLVITFDDGSTRAVDGSWSAGIAVNNRDEVAAYRSVTDHTYLDCHAFLVSGRTWTPIGNLGPDRPMSYPCDINDHGAVVGLSSYTYWTNSHAFLWQGGVIRDLNDFVPPSSGWVLSAAYAINNAGQIVGTGTLNGQSRAWLLTPAGMTSVAAPGGETAPPGTALAAVITPNPTRAECEISFELRTAGAVRAELFAVDGRRVATIADQDLARGRHRLAWDGRARGGERAAPGVYWLRIAAGGETATRAVHVVR